MYRILLHVGIGVIWMKIAITDWREKRIPNRLIGSLLLCAVFSIILVPELSIGERLAGGVAVSGLLLFIMWVRPHAFGAGDVKLMAVSGFVLGIGKALAAFVFAVGAAALYCIVGSVRGTVKKSSEIAFGPFLCIGLFLAMIFGEAFVRWYLKK